MDYDDQTDYADGKKKTLKADTDDLEIEEKPA